MDLPFIYRRKSVIYVGLHRTIFIPQLLAVENSEAVLVATVK